MKTILNVAFDGNDLCLFQQNEKENRLCDNITLYIDLHLSALKSAKVSSCRKLPAVYDGILNSNTRELSVSHPSI